jgi:sulfite reductase alpha subunit-like flavoprotein
MRKNVPHNIFDQLEFGVIGLGDSSYEKFNFTAKKLYKRFVQLGAKSLLDVCLCDEQQREGIEGAYAKWISQFWPYFVQEYDTNVVSSILKYKIIKVEEISIIENNFEDNEIASESKPFYAKITKNDRVTNEKHFQNVRFIEFDCANTNCMKYEAGDVLALRPSNLKQNIDKFLQIFEHLNLNLNQKIKILPNYENEIEIDTNLNQIYTIQDLVEKYFDLNSIPRMSFFEQFGEFATDELEKEKLKEFMTPDGLEELYNYCYRPRRSMIEIFYDFPKTSKNINSLEILIDLIPSIKPRSFSIASSPFVHKDRIQLLVAVVEYKTRLYETRKGTCSYWLSTVNPNQDIKIPVWIRKGSFKIDWLNPLICIGPGTGIILFKTNLFVINYESLN